MNLVKQLLITFGLIALLAACSDSSNSSQSNVPIVSNSVVEPIAAVETSVETAPPATATIAPIPTPTLTPAATPTPFVLSNPSPPCGSLLPLTLPEKEEPTYQWAVPPLSEELLSDDVITALDQFFSQPEDVSLVVYQPGYEGIGFYHNATTARPLASVSKIVLLAAYAEAVVSGELDPEQPVLQQELERFYLPKSDLGAHTKALSDLRDTELTLDGVVWMMMRHSANSATDFMHYLLGHERVEAMVGQLELETHTAPCPFIGRLLTMGNHEIGDARQLIDALAVEPAQYGLRVMDYSDRYIQDPVFRQGARDYWGQRGNPPEATQAYFVQQLETRSTAQEYADLMAGIVMGDLLSAEANAIVRHHLGWPLQEFASNSENYRSIGYKNGTFPGMLTTVYYAEPTWSTTPIVVALFYDNLPDSVYDSWRRSLPHDALAHWLMANPSGIHNMHVLRNSAENPPPTAVPTPTATPSP